MKITFSLLKAPAKVALQQGQKSFDEQGGSIGRGDGNTWVLVDPDKFLSSKHCVVTCEQAQFYITDTSANGVFLNGASLPIGRNNKVTISDGDTLDLAEYRLRVSIEKSSVKVSPFAQVAPSEPEPFNAGAQWGELEEAPAFNGAGLFPSSAEANPFDLTAEPKNPFSPPAGGFQGDNPFGADSFGSADPFAGATASSDPFTSADPFAGSNPFAPNPPKVEQTFTQNEGGNRLHDAISLPVPSAQPNAPIPDDFWNSLGGSSAAKDLGMPPGKPLDPFASADPFSTPDASRVPPVPVEAPKPAPIPPPAPIAPIPAPIATTPPHVPSLQPPIDDALGQNPFEHILPATQGLAPDDASGQLYPLGSAYDLAPAPVPGKVPLSERLKAIPPESDNSVPPASWDEPLMGAGNEPSAAPVNAPPVLGGNEWPATPVIPTPPLPPISAPPASPVPSVATRSGGAQPEPSAQNLIAALGLTGKLHAEQQDALPQLIGEITREALDGLLQILRARNSIKNEFRVAVTTIQPKENNPIKFATDVDDALELLFVRQSKGFKPPLESVQDSFESIMDHQVAILAGIRAAFKSLLTRFDPVQLEQQFERLGKTGGIIPGMKGAKCWSAYDDFYQELMSNYENSFQNLFGDEFVHAYEEQLRKLAIARKRQNPQQQ
ncbi:MAG: hypothetical protein RL497_2601 [Pseudomonadota bacterium]|jgi:type VI secretion system FHA domain protein